MDKTIDEIKGISYKNYDGVKVSKNDRAKKIMGYRNQEHPGANALFEPYEMGYACPVCNICNEKLHWSEYKGFIWCQNCNLDIPSCLCVKYPEPHLSKKVLNKKDKIIKATKIFLDTIEYNIKSNEIIELAENFDCCPHCGNYNLENNHYCEECKQRIVEPDDAYWFAQYLKKELK